ncbi:NADH-flavin reductase [Streptomyces ruber]|uniref:NADH-flavin reductase n=2 Tax=Streptomyces TaxID=1883 RepID=A0A918ETJ6_9ACTN|nr:NAD(P)H-binding protein [Streptomyces ruber]GGQ63049.1 NADH-flavin reductase [Streptomyces ruber]
MRLTVFGATGGVGQEIVRLALAAGHQVTAVVRDPARLTVTGEGLEVAGADLTDPGPLLPALTGRDAVLSGLGARSRKDAGVAARLTRTVLRAMDSAGVLRIVVVSAAPLAPPPQDDPVVDRVVRAILRRVLADTYADLREMEAELERSAADWTSVRPPKLTDGPLTGTYRTAVGGVPRAGRTLARADVAHAMLAAAGDPGTVKQTVGVAY